MPARLKLFLPLFLFAVLALFLFRGLSLDPKERRGDNRERLRATDQEIELPSVEGEQRWARSKGRSRKGTHGHC